MEFKKKTIIWEDNSEPPKDYIWIKSDGKAYEFDYNDRRWKESTSINVNNNGSDDGGGGSSDSDVFFVPATIQPKYFICNGSVLEVMEIKDYTSDIEMAQFLYNKEDIISLGIEETDLNSLTQVTIMQAFQDSQLVSPIKGLIINKEVFKNTTILGGVSKGTEDFSPEVNVYTFEGSEVYHVYKISDDIFFILKNKTKINPN